MKPDQTMETIDPRLPIIALLISAMGAMELGVLAILERSAFGLLFDTEADIEDGSITEVFSALKLLVDVLPLALGVFIVGTLISGALVAKRTGWAAVPVIGMAGFVAMIIYNVVLTDTAGVVDTLKASSTESTITEIRAATQSVMRQHYLGLLGFFAVAANQAVVVAKSLPQDSQEPPADHLSS